MKEKICFVVQRYGTEINGGAEFHCRQIAEHMTDEYDITVLTTKALDYMTWKDQYESSEEWINGVRVLRFSVAESRDLEKFNEINFEFQLTRKVDETEWLKQQGPYVPELIEYIGEHKEEYIRFIFFTYLYYTTVEGIKEVKDKAILVPDAHDELFLYMKIYKELFHMPKGFFFNTEEEKQLVKKRFALSDMLYEIGGIGIEIPDKPQKSKFKDKHGVNDYILYAGRIDFGKNCHVLFQYFDLYKKRNPGSIKLLLIGQEVMDVPVREDVISLGFVSETEKYDAMAGAKCLILPSKFESLSIVVLESMKLSVPVIVNGECEVLKGHCVKSNGGLYYKGYWEFEGTLNYMLTHEEERLLMGRNGKEYVDSRYQWTNVTENLKKLIKNTE